MQKLALLSIIVFIISCSGSDQVEISPLIFDRPIATPHFDQGGLIVRKGDLSDTIFDCRFRISPDYEILKNDSIEYLFTSCQISGGGDNLKTFFLWSLEEETFLDTLFYQVVYENQVYSDTSNDYRICVDREVRFKIIGNEVELKIDTLACRVHWDTAETVDTISAGSKVNRYEFKL